MVTPLHESDRNYSHLNLWVHSYKYCKNNDSQPWVAGVFLDSNSKKTSLPAMQAEVSEGCSPVPRLGTNAVKNI